MLFKMPYVIVDSETGNDNIYLYSVCYYQNKFKYTNHSETHKVSTYLYLLPCTVNP